MPCLSPVQTEEPLLAAVPILLSHRRELSAAQPEQRGEWRQKMDVVEAQHRKKPVWLISFSTE